MLLSLSPPLFASGCMMFAPSFRQNAKSGESAPIAGAAAEEKAPKKAAAKKGKGKKGKKSAAAAEEEDDDATDTKDSKAEAQEKESTGTKVSCFSIHLVLAYMICMCRSAQSRGRERRLRCGGRRAGRRPEQKENQVLMSLVLIPDKRCSDLWCVQNRQTDVHCRRGGCDGPQSAADPLQSARAQSQWLGPFLLIALEGDREADAHPNLWLAV
jgi:hypothetical protein